MPQIVGVGLPFVSKKTWELILSFLLHRQLEYIHPSLLAIVNLRNIFYYLTAYFANLHKVYDSY